tara:strand:- start:141 stop:341 length:201 start_codon:yes stop_codon:yes gene_type:complete
MIEAFCFLEAIAMLISAPFWLRKREVAEKEEFVISVPQAFMLLFLFLLGGYFAYLMILYAIHGPQF